MQITVGAAVDSAALAVATTGDVDIDSMIKRVKLGLLWKNPNMFAIFFLYFVSAYIC